jgi:hypothetical protein
MQLFGDEGKEKKNTVQVGNNEIKVIKASSLSEGTHAVRFYPLSPQFYDGADYLSIVQHVHWLNNKPCICRRTSYDYTVPDTQNKPLIDTSCVICNDKFAWFKKAKSIKDAQPQESERLRNIGKDLMEKISASSLVSLTDSNGNLTFPAILRYGKELLNQLELHAYRIIENKGPHLCDPAKGYMFDIIIGRNDGGFRTYKNSMPSVNTSPADITKAPWNWSEVCEAIRSEIMHVLTPDEVHEFYLNNYGGSQQQQQTFHHPAFQEPNSNNNSGNNGSAVAPNGNSDNNGGFVPPKSAENNTSSFTPLSSGGNSNNQETQTPSFEAPAGGNNVVNQNSPAPTFSTQGVSGNSQSPGNQGVQDKPKLYTCHSQSPGGSGYDQADSNCTSCPQVKSCYEHAASFSSKNAIQPNSGNIVTAPSNGGPNDSGATFDNSQVTKRLDELNSKMQG